MVYCNQPPWATTKALPPQLVRGHSIGDYLSSDEDAVHLTTSSGGCSMLNFWIWFDPRGSKIQMSSGWFGTCNFHWPQRFHFWNRIAYLYWTGAPASVFSIDSVWMNIINSRIASNHNLSHYSLLWIYKTFHYLWTWFLWSDDHLVSMMITNFKTSVLKIANWRRIVWTFKWTCNKIAWICFNWRYPINIRFQACFQINWI
jgi:hypothetical protein